MPIEYRNPATLTPYHQNARTHPPKQIDKLASIIKRYGFHDSHAIAVDEDGVIVWGHGRLLAAQKAGLDSVPVEVLTGLSEEDVRALRIADNAVSEQSEWSLEALEIELMDLDAAGYPTELLALNDDLLEELGHVLDVKQSSGEWDDEDDDDKDGQPRGSDDEYSVFELVMMYENKLRLVKVLNDTKQQEGLEKQEDALMHIINNYTHG